MSNSDVFMFLTALKHVTDSICKHQWRRNEINIAGVRRGPKGWAEGGVWGEGRCLGSAVGYPVGSKAKPNPHCKVFYKQVLLCIPVICKQCTCHTICSLTYFLLCSHLFWFSWSVMFSLHKRHVCCRPTFVYIWPRQRCWTCLYV